MASGSHAADPSDLHAPDIANLEALVGFTCRYTAGLRHIESTTVPQPLLHDPLAGLLAGERGLQLAQQELEGLIAAQGPEKHLRVPARSRLIDDIVARELPGLEAAGAAAGAAAASAAAGTAGGVQSGPPRPRTQLVSLGAGMCTRPWRLACLAPHACHVLELDLPHVVSLKQLLLQQAGAQLRHDHQDYHTHTTSHHQEAAAAGGSAAATQEAPRPRFPLFAARYGALGADLSDRTEGSLRQVLQGAGWDPGLPTLWVLEGLVYYMPLAAASQLLCDLAALSAPGSRLVATCIDTELLEASRERVSKGHVFADLWHFDALQLLYDSTAFASAWALDPGQEHEGQQDGACAVGAGQPGARGAGCRQPLPKSTRQLAAELLGADTYVALYGGSELLFTAGLRGAGGRG